MDFDEIYRSIIPSQESILEQIDEYTLYCYYTKEDTLIPGRAYPAPYRNDSVPSFCVFPSNSSNVEYLWKDHATGEKGNIFQLIKKIEGLKTLQEVLARINEDFGLGYTVTTPVRTNKITLYERPALDPIKIRVINREFTDQAIAYWDQFKIDKTLLNLYNTTQVAYYYSYDGQEAPTTATSLTFAYRIGEYYQLYSPYNAKGYKFRNDLPENYFFGYIQLPPTGDKLIIDKSSKDVIFCRRLGYWAVSGKSETTFLPHKKVLELKERFQEIYLTLDNDGPGRAMTEKYIKEYPFLKPRFLPNELAKDKTDACIKHGFDQAEQAIKQLLL